MNKQQGFSLLEILIAFSIMALALGIMLKIFSGGVNTAAVAEDYTVAVQIAESLLAKTSSENPLPIGETNGEYNDKYVWQVSVRPFQFIADNLDTRTIPAELFKIAVTVQWDENREVELVTLKLAKTN